MTNDHVPGVQPNPLAYAAGASSGRSWAHVRMHRTPEERQADSDRPEVAKWIVRLVCLPTVVTAVWMLGAVVWGTFTG